MFRFYAIISAKNHQSLCKTHCKCFTFLQNNGGKPSRLFHSKVKILAPPLF